MKEKIVYGFLVFWAASLAGAPVLYAEPDFMEVHAEAEEIDSDPSSFEGDSESMPGERAPEELPMSDAPALAGMGIE